jgi:hypothetical protein
VSDISKVRILIFDVLNLLLFLLLHFAKHRQNKWLESIQLNLGPAERLHLGWVSSETEDKVLDVVVVQSEKDKLQKSGQLPITFILKLFGYGVVEYQLNKKED